MLGPVGIQRLLMAIALVAYGFVLLPGYEVVVLTLAFDCVMADLFLYWTRLGDVARQGLDENGELPSDFNESAQVVSVVDEVVYVLAMGLAFFFWSEPFGLPENAPIFITAAVIATVALTIGVIAPMLPYNQYSRARPLYTMESPTLWNLTNRLVSYGSCPLAIAYISCVPTALNFWLLTALFVASWLGVPAILVALYRRKQGR